QYLSSLLKLSLRKKSSDGVRCLGGLMQFAKRCDRSANQALSYYARSGKRQNRVGETSHAFAISNFAGSRMTGWFVQSPLLALNGSFPVSTWISFIASFGW